MLTDLLKTGRDLSTISGRFNALLDITGEFPIPKNERVKALTDRFSVSRAAAYKWTGDDILPRQQVFLQIVEFCLIRLQSEYKVQTIMAWIEYGDAIPNVFHDTKSFEGPTLEEIRRAFSCILSESQNLNIAKIDQAMSETDLQDLIKGVLENQSSTDNHEPDADYVRALLKSKLRDSLVDKLS